MREQSLNNSNKFLSVPVGDMITIKPTMIISGDTIIKYKNNENGICALAALSMNFKNNFTVYPIMKIKILLKFI